MDRKLYNKDYYQKHKEKLKKDCREYYEKNRKEQYPKRKVYQIKFNFKRRMKIIELLGGKCVQCGESDWRCLQVDHIKGNGYLEREKNISRTVNSYIFKRLEEGSRDYQLLCANCNWKKRYDNKEYYHRNNKLRNNAKIL